MGIAQINQAIIQMDQVTQQNAALVEQAAGAAATLQEQAAKLAQAVGVFKFDGDSAAARQSRSSARKTAVRTAATRPLRTAVAPTPQPDGLAPPLPRRGANGNRFKRG
jgi:hypothetical protein